MGAMGREGGLGEDLEARSARACFLDWLDRFFDG